MWTDCRQSDQKLLWMSLFHRPTYQAQRQPLKMLFILCATAQWAAHLTATTNPERIASRLFPDVTQTVFRAPYVTLSLHSFYWLPVGTTTIRFKPLMLVVQLNTPFFKVQGRHESRLPVLPLRWEMNLPWPSEQRNRCLYMKNKDLPLQQILKWALIKIRTKTSIFVSVLTPLLQGFSLMAFLVADLLN